jgi:hypothetical protein
MMVRLPTLFEGETKLINWLSEYAFSCGEAQPIETQKNLIQKNQFYKQKFEIPVASGLGNLTVFFEKETKHEPVCSLILAPIGVEPSLFENFFLKSLQTNDNTKQNFQNRSNTTFIIFYWDGSSHQSTRDLQTATRTLPLFFNGIRKSSENFPKIWNLCGIGTGALIALAACTHLEVSSLVQRCTIAFPESAGDITLFENAQDFGWKTAIAPQIQIQSFLEDIFNRLKILNQIECSTHWIFSRNKNKELSPLLKQVFNSDENLTRLSVEEFFLSTEASRWAKNRLKNNWQILLSTITRSLTS